jgi:hypothetical protein
MPRTRLSGTGSWHSWKSVSFRARLRAWSADCSVWRHSVESAMCFSTERKYHNLIVKTIDERLSFVPDQETRNRKPLEGPTSFGATWELRFGANNRFRVFYEVDLMEQSVGVLAIEEKEGNRLFIGGKTCGKKSRGKWTNLGRVLKVSFAFEARRTNPAGECFSAGEGMHSVVARGALRLSRSVPHFLGRRGASRKDDSS